VILTILKNFSEKSIISALSLVLLSKVPYTERGRKMTDSELDRCMRKFYTSVYSTALCHCKNPADADDIAQDVFLALYTYNGAFTDDEHIKAWLLRCTINKSINVFRSHWNQYSLPLEAAVNRYSESPEHNSASELLSIIMKLKKKNSLAMYLYYYEEYKIGEIADMLHISETAVRARLLRGRKQLKKLLDSERN